jgi:hypothetical protein
MSWQLSKILVINIGEKIDFFLNNFFSPTSPSQEKEELYDLIKDSAEKRNLASEKRNVCIQMKSDLDALVATKTTIRRSELVDKSDDEMTIIRKELKNLGYL